LSGKFMVNLFVLQRLGKKYDRGEERKIRHSSKIQNVQSKAKYGPLENFPDREDSLAAGISIV